MEYNPVCVGGDQEYSNPCLAECDGYMEYDLGVCEEVCICTMEYNPVCVGGDQEYSNACLAECDGHMEYDVGVCESIGDSCASHDDCPSESPFCYESSCSSCEECHFCSDGVDGTCGPCGDGYPTMEDGPCEGEEPVEPEECDGMTAGQYDCVCPSGFVKEATYIGDRRKLAIWGEAPYCGENACMFYQEAPDMMVGGVDLTNECYNYVEDFTYEVHSVIGEEELDEAYHQDGCEMFTFACVEESPEDLPVCDAGPYPEEAVGGEAMCCFYHAWFMMLNNCQFKETEECPESHEYACTMPEPIEPSEEECVCIEVYNPVCVEGDKEYSNSCYAECDGYMEYEVGVCIIDGECTDVIVNVGAYPSEISWTIVGESFSCESPSYDSALQNSELRHPCCVDKSDTVVLTCSDSYGDSFNGGYIEVHGEIYCDGEFGSEETITLGEEIEDSTEICICSMEYNPVCVGGDQEYSNPCLAECDGHMEYDVGVCEVIPECTDVVVNVGGYPGEISWTIAGESFACESPSYDSETGYTDVPHPCCVDESETVVLTCVDSYGDSFNGGYIKINDKVYCDGMFGSVEIITLGEETEESEEECTVEIALSNFMCPVAICPAPVCEFGFEAVFMDKLMEDICCLEPCYFECVEVEPVECDGMTPGQIHCMCPEGLEKTATLIEGRRKLAIPGESAYCGENSCMFSEDPGMMMVGGMSLFYECYNYEGHYTYEIHSALEGDELDEDMHEDTCDMFTFSCEPACPIYDCPTEEMCPQGILESGTDDDGCFYCGCTCEYDAPECSSCEFDVVQYFDDAGCATSCECVDPDYCLTNSPAMDAMGEIMDEGVATACAFPNEIHVSECPTGYHIAFSEELSAFLCQMDAEPEPCPTASESLYALYAESLKCPYAGGVRAFKSDFTTIGECALLCHEDDDCTYFSTDEENHCIGCTVVPTESDERFTTYSMTKMGEVTTLAPTYAYISDETKCGNERTFKYAYTTVSACNDYCLADETCNYFSVNPQWCIGCPTEPTDYHSGFLSYVSDVESMPETTEAPPPAWVFMSTNSKCGANDADENRVFKMDFTTVDDCDLVCQADPECNYFSENGDLCIGCAIEPFTYWAEANSYMCEPESDCSMYEGEELITCLENRNNYVEAKCSA